MALPNTEILTSKAPQRVSPETVEQAVNALLKWRDSKLQSEKPKLFDPVDEFIYLILTLKKIPPKGRVKPHQILLPHSLASDFSEHCLIIDDRSNSGISKEDIQKKIKAECIPVAKVLKLSKLKSNYQAYEAKRKLCDSYNMFFADRRVIPLLPRLIGKSFFRKKKVPIAINLLHKNWKEQIEKACRSALLFLSTGTCAVVKVAKPSMGKDEIVDNVVAAINGIVELVPKKWNNVRSLHLKLFESVSLPIYQALPDYKLKIESVKERVESLEEEEDKVVSGDERKKAEKVRKKKGRIHEVKYMDNSVGEDELGVGEDKLGVGEDVGQAEDNDDARNADTQDVELGAVLVEKKRKKKTKDQDAVPAQMNGLKRMKKSSRDKHDDGPRKKKDRFQKKENKDHVGKSKKLLTTENKDEIDKKTRKPDEQRKVKVKKSKKSAE